MEGFWWLLQSPQGQFGSLCPGWLAGTVLHLLDGFWLAELSPVSSRAGLKPDLALLEGLEPNRPRRWRGTIPAGVRPGGAEVGFVLPNLVFWFFLSYHSNSEVIILIQLISAYTW